MHWSNIAVRVIWSVATVYYSLLQCTVPLVHMRPKKPKLVIMSFTGNGVPGKKFKIVFNHGPVPRQRFCRIYNFTLKTSLHSTAFVVCHSAFFPLWCFLVPFLFQSCRNVNSHFVSGNSGLCWGCCTVFGIFWLVRWNVPRRMQFSCTDRDLIHKCHWLIIKVFFWSTSSQDIALHWFNGLLEIIFVYFSNDFQR